MPYSGDPTASAADEVRYLIDDVDPATPMLTDEEINYEIAKWSVEDESMTFVAFKVAESLANRFAGGVNVSVGGVSVDVGSLAESYAALAERLKAAWQEGLAPGDIDIENLLTGQTPDLSIKPLKFAMDLMDNPEAGQQDYGGDQPANWPYYYEPFPGQ